MSWILKNKKKTLLMLFMFGVGVFALNRQIKILYLELLIIFFLIVILRINKKAIELMNKQVAIFEPYSNMRNVDCLVIGDMYRLPLELKNKNTIQLAAPERTLYGSFEILRHTHGVLKDDGTAEVIIVVKKRNIYKKVYSVFDVFFFHYITLQVKNLYDLKRKSSCLIRYAPLEVIKLVLGLYSSKYSMCEDLDEKLTTFCQQRGYSVRFLCKE